MPLCREPICFPISLFLFFFCSTGFRWSAHSIGFSLLVSFAGTTTNNGDSLVRVLQSFRILRTSFGSVVPLSLSYLPLLRSNVRARPPVLLYCLYITKIKLFVAQAGFRNLSILSFRSSRLHLDPLPSTRGLPPLRLSQLVFDGRVSGDRTIGIAGFRWFVCSD